MAATTEVTELLVQWSNGDESALQHLMPLVYEECRHLAARQMRQERGDHTLSPTALVHELYLRLVDQNRATWKNRAHFFATTARMMRHILVDHARGRAAAKRGGARVLVSLDAVQDVGVSYPVADALAIDEALHRLAERDPDQERIVELRFFAGLTTDEIAAVLGRSPRTVKREWQLARAWLFRELYPELVPTVERR